MRTKISEMTVDTTFPDDAYVPIISDSLDPANNYKQQIGARINLLTGTTLASGNMGTFTSPLIDDNVSAKAALESIATNLAAAGGSGNVGFQQSGSNLASGLTIQDQLRKFQRPEQRSGASDNAKWTNAVSAVGTTGELMASGTYSLTGVTLAQYSKVNGSDAELQRASGSDPILTVPTNSDGLQTVHFAKIANVEINSAISGTRTGTAVKVENNAAVVLDTVQVRGAVTGFMFDRCQFAGLSYLKAYDCTTGFNIRPSLDAGGGNSLTFTHALAIGNDLGVLLDNSGAVFPHHSVVFVNPQILVNKVCGMAVIGASASLKTQVVQLGAAPEANANNTVSGSASITVNGNVIPRSSYYCKWADLSLIGVFIGEYDNCNPMTILEASILSLHDFVGYGGPANIAIQADADSSVVISGNFGLIGTTQQVTKFTGHLSQSASRGILQGPVRRVMDPLTTNEATDPEVGNYNAAPGVTSATVSTDAKGRYYNVDFAASAGNADSNVIHVNLPGGTAERVIVRFDIEADADASFIAGIYANEGNSRFDLKAGVPQTVVYWCNNVTNFANLLTIFPSSTNGPAVKLRNCHIATGDLDDPNFIARCNAICAGHYNPNIAAVVPYGTASAAPTSSAYPTGAIVWNSAPTAGGVSYWQHVGSGTWKAVSLAA